MRENNILTNIFDKIYTTEKYALGYSLLSGRWDIRAIIYDELE
jgi:hypothetical protein